MKRKVTKGIYTHVAVLLVVIASSVASTATWFMFYQPHEPSYLRKMD